MIFIDGLRMKDAVKDVTATVIASDQQTCQVSNQSSRVKVKSLKSSPEQMSSVKWFMRSPRKMLDFKSSKVSVLSKLIQSQVLGALSRKIRLFL